MEIYELKVKEHEEELGELGLLVNVGRTHFSPYDGLSVAHDIIEHTFRPHPNPAIDELMAFEAIVAGRIETRWTGRGYLPSTVQDLSIDVCSLVSGCTMRGESIKWSGSRSYLQRTCITEEIRGAVIKGVKEAEDECEEKLDCDINSTVSWIIKGYQAYKRRFRRLDIYNVSNRLFNSIVSCCDDLLKHAEEGETHSLHIDFQAYRAFIDVGV
jgi:hypothetical protein